jgi:hypothetical protein
VRRVKRALLNINSANLLLGPEEIQFKVTINKLYYPCDIISKNAETSSYPNVYICLRTKYLIKLNRTLKTKVFIRTVISNDAVVSEIAVIFRIRINVPRKINYKVKLGFKAANWVL